METLKVLIFIILGLSLGMEYAYILFNFLTE